MYKIVQKLKLLKPKLRAEAWNSGNFCKKVENLKSNLTNTQSAQDCNSFNEDLKECEVKLLKDYREAALEEERMLKQKFKIHWLNVGEDQNNKKSMQLRA